MEEAKVSIIVPVRNGEEFLRPCLDSIAAQTHTHIEVLVVEDGSTDSTPGILAEYAARDHRFAIIPPEGSGVSAARNTALRRATGDYVMMVDADDVLHPQAVANLLETIVATGADIATGRWSQNEHTALAPSHRPVKYKTYTAAEALELTLYQRSGFDPSPWAKLYAASVWREVRFRPGTRFEDLDIIADIYAHAHRVVAIDAMVYYYRRNPASFINTPSRGRLDCLEVTRRIEEHAAAVAKDDKTNALLAAARERRMSAAFNMLGLCRAQGWTAEYRQCIDIIRSRRIASLLSPRTRLKSRAGALLSLLLPYSLLSRLLPH